MPPSPQTIAKNTASALIREARAAGWLQARFDIKPDGGMTIVARMAEQEANDDFSECDLRMGK